MILWDKKRPPGERKRASKWRLKFAWFPTILSDGRIAWLERIEVRCFNIRGTYFWRSRRRLGLDVVSWGWGS